MGSIPIGTILNNHPRYLALMMKKLVILVLGILFIMSILGGVWSMTTAPPRTGFTETDYIKPAASGALDMDSIPPYSNTIHDSPDLSIQFSLGHFYKEYGSVIDVTATNEGHRDIFLIAFAFEWVDTGQIFSKYLNLTIKSGEIEELGLLNIEGPGITGQTEYRILVQALEKRTNVYYKLEVRDDDWVPFESSTINVLDEAMEMEYDYQINYYHYFDRTNELITPDSPSITFLANIATTQLGSGYKVSKIAAIFDHVDEILTYRLEPDGEDDWQTPEDCISTKTGDCEDYSLLIAAMVNSIGGTSRMYLIEGHAFAAVYIGNTTQDLQTTEESISAYYNTELKIYYLEDETGYWVIADPLGSFYFGGSPVGAAPVSGGDDWEWTFEETEIVHAIDITGIVPEDEIWYNIIFWMFMMFLTGIILIAMTTYGSKKENAVPNNTCALCNLHINESPVICPNCNARSHISCLNAGRYCPKCNTAIVVAGPPVRPPHTPQPQYGQQPQSHQPLPQQQPATTQPVRDTPPPPSVQERPLPPPPPPEE